MKVEIASLDFDKGDGLIPVIVQDEETRDVLTLAYCNREALERTIKTKKSWFWSRSRQKLWMKGEESGNVQHITGIISDCDLDAIIYLVNPTGPACHTGRRLCFFNTIM